MLSERAIELLAALRRTLPTWNCSVAGERVEFRRVGGGTYRPRRHPTSWSELLATLEISFAAHGIARGRLLPLRGLGDAELTFSAVQALDPYLKHRERYTYSSGYLPQPVVRFTGERDGRDELRPGFLTSFVNVSCVQPITAVAEHAEMIDAWLTVLSRLGFHARHLAIGGSLTAWRRVPVSGITLRFRHQDLTLGDAVLLWNSDDPTLLATDIGSGLERLRWALIRQPWTETVFGRLATVIDATTLDALRTATLIVGSGTIPAPRGPGNAVRRLLGATDRGACVLGSSRIVRWAHEYWSAVRPLPVPWPEVCRIVDAETTDAG